MYLETVQHSVHEVLDQVSVDELGESNKTRPQEDIVAADAEYKVQWGSLIDLTCVHRFFGNSGFPLFAGDGFGSLYALLMMQATRVFRLDT